MKATHPAYGSYKPSGYYWVGDIPAHWAVEKLGTSLRTVSDKNRPDLPLLSITREKGVIERDLNDEESNHNFIPDDLSGYKVLRTGQFGMNKMKAWQGSYGVSQHTGIVSPAYFIFDFTKEIDPDFFNRAIRSKLYVSFFGSASDGVRIGQWDLNKARMREIPLLVPPLPEQRAIAAFLDDKCAKIEGAVKIKEDQIALLRERRQIIIQNAVTRGLNPAATMKDSGIDWTGEIPAHWEVKPLMGISDIVDPNPSHRNPEYVEEGFPFISTQEFFGVDKIEIDTPRRVSEKTVAEQEARCRFKNGSLVFSRKGTIGAVRVLPVGVRLGILDSLCVINPKGFVLSDFLFWTLTANYLEAQYGAILRGAALPQLSVGRVRSLKVILPPEVEQREITDFLRIECQRLNECITIKERQIAALKEYKTSLINAAVTGKIKVI